MSKIVLAISTVFGRGRTHIPSKVRKRLELRDGDEVHYFLNEYGEVVMEKAPELTKRQKKDRLGRY